MLTCRDLISSAAALAPAFLAGWGLAILVARARFARMNAAERFALIWALGYGALTAVFFLCGLVGLLGPWTVALATAAFGIAALIAGLRRAVNPKSKIQNPKSRELNAKDMVCFPAAAGARDLHYLLGVLLVVPLGLLTFQILSKEPWAWDAVRYHQQGHLIAYHHSIAPPELTDRGLMPQATYLNWRYPPAFYYGVAYIKMWTGLDNNATPRLLGWLFTMAAVAGLGGAVARRAHAAAGLIAALILSTLPAFVAYSEYTEMDVPLGLFRLLALVYLYEWALDPKESALLALAGVLGGCGAWMKPEGKYYLVIDLLCVAAVLVRYRNQFGSFRPARGADCQSARPKQADSLLHVARLAVRWAVPAAVPVLAWYAFSTVYDLDNTQAAAGDFGLLLTDAHIRHNVIADLPLAWSTWQQYFVFGEYWGPSLMLLFITAAVWPRRTLTPPNALFLAAIGLTLALIFAQAIATKNTSPYFATMSPALMPQTTYPRFPVQIAPFAIFWAVQLWSAAATSRGEESS